MPFILSCKSRANHPPPDLGNARWNSAHGHECLFGWVCNGFPPSSGVKCCTLAFSENKGVINLLTYFANLFTRPQAGYKSPCSCKSGNYSPVVQCDSVLGERLHTRWSGRRWRGAKTNKIEGQLRYFVSLAVNQFDGVECPNRGSKGTTSMGWALWALVWQSQSQSPSWYKRTFIPCKHALTPWCCF